MKSKKTSLVLILFLLGIFMGAIDSGIVSPAREIIQRSFGVTPGVGTWLITIYTLCYAVAMPIVSKLSDRYGHKKIYTLSIAIFGLGSLLTGLSNFYGDFNFLLVSRVIQAIGAGGIMPIATAVIGQSFPEEKRGSALGLVGGIYGVATIIGPTLGSAILNASGNENWGWLFFINVPISVIIILLSLKMEDSPGNSFAPMDLLGGALIAGTVGSLMYALTNLDFFNIGESLKSIDVYPYLIAFIILIPLLIIVEMRAKDAILNLKYFRSRQMIVVFALAFIVGMGMMGMVFVPQFAENTLKIKTGSGGYLITLLAVFSGVAAPFSGRLIDKKGAPFVMILGFFFTVTGTLWMGFVAAKAMTFITLFVGLALMGFGVGFTMGAPLNYLVLQAVPKEEGATALATMSLIRSLGVTISPSLMIGFIVNAAKETQTALMTTLMGSMGQAAPQAVQANAQAGSNSGFAKAFSTLQTADVTDIVDRIKDILKNLIPAPNGDAAAMGVEKMRATIENTFQTTLNSGYTNMFIAAAIIAGLGLIISFLLKNKKQTV